MATEKNSPVAHHAAHVHGFWNEFKAFAFKGNMIDLAVGIIIGAAFNQLVQSLVNDIVMPPIGLMLGNVDFTQLYVDLSGKGYESLKAAEAAGAPVIRYGAFFTEVINFLILAVTVFMVVKLVMRNRPVEETK
jgi:large conductance mechanosensitive channel